MRRPGAAVSRARVTATPWPEADALFRSDPRWRGSDDAYSIELAPERTLWLFGDTFVGDTSRAEAAFIRNSVGIQDGDDPASASMTFHWGAKNTSFFAAQEGTWYWPLHGAFTEAGLVLFMMAVRSPVGGTGAIEEWRRLGPLGFFEVFGWAALIVDNPHDDPPSWSIRRIAAETGALTLGASVLAEDGALLAYAWDERWRLSLARLHVEGASITAEWWTGSAWSLDAGLREQVIEHGATEFTVHRDPATGALCQTQLHTREQSIALRWADAPQGPWSEPRHIFAPEETMRPEAFVYAAKAHPQLAGADLVLTYASNADVDTCLADESLYYPRFVRLEMERP